MNDVNASAPENTAPTTDAAGRKIWTVGTLTYTTGGLVILFCWLLAGDFAWSMKERSVMWVVQLLIKKFEASDMIAGLLIGTLPQALALILTPIVSYRSDRHRGRWGRRIPYLIIPTPIAALSMVGLAFSPAIGTWLHGVLGETSPGLNPSILIVFGVFWTVFEVATVTANAVFFGLINDVVPKAVLGRFYGMFRAMGLIVAMAFNYWLFGKAETHYTAIFIGIGILYGVGFTTMCFKVKEGEYPPPAPIPPSRAGGLVAAVRTYFRECFTRPYFLWIYASVSFAWMAMLTANLFNLFFAKSVGMSMDTYGKYLAATFLISFFMSYFIGALADRWHPLRLSLGLLAIFAVVMVAGGLLVTDDRSFGVALIAYGVLGGSWQTAAASLTMRLFPQARYAQIDSAKAIVQSFGMMLVGPAMGYFLDLSGHDYRHAYTASGIMALLSLLLGLVVHAKFMKLGGPKGYVAPE
ncbi:MAG TPA: MFS transporter [Opitutus sp.]|nr:MFS transporter [Opitutus sp.]